MRILGIGWTALALVCCVGARAAQAQGSGAQGPTTTVLKTTVADEGDAGLAGAVERTVRARLDALGVVETEGTPGLGLEDLQLAVGCVGETPECLRAVADQLEVQALLLSSVDRTGDTLVLTLTFFRKSDGSTEEVVRRASGDEADNRILDAIDAALREMFDLPPPEEPEEPEAGTETGTGTGTGTETGTGTDTGVRTGTGPEEDDGLSPIPFVVAGAGVAALAVGVGFGVKSQNTEDDYAQAEPTTPQEVDAALSTLDDAQREALIGNVLMGVGGGLVAAGTVLLVVLEVGGSSEEQRVGVAPTLSPNAVGLVLTGSLGDSR